MVGPSWQQVCAMGYQIPGVGVIPGDVVAGICERFDTRIRRVLLDPASGTTVETGAAGYTPSPAVRRFVTHRDGTCRAPGCARAARFCDLDHVIPWPLGRTVGSNLLTLCRRHHRMKHTTRWQVVMDAGGVCTWTDPFGQQFAHPPGQPPRHPRRLMPTSVVQTGTARSRRAAPGRPRVPRRLSRRSSSSGPSAAGLSCALPPRSAQDKGLPALSCSPSPGFTVVVGRQATRTSAGREQPDDPPPPPSPPLARPAPACLTFAGTTTVPRGGAEPAVQRPEGEGRRGGRR